MSELFSQPAGLERVEYVRLYFHLQVVDCFDLPRSALLQLRREMLQALGHLSLTGQTEVVERIKQLLLPKFPVDPQLRRLVQRPAPAMVLAPDLSQYGLMEPQQRIVLPVLFIGPGIRAISAFRVLLDTMGAQGIYAGSGKFFLEAIETEDNSGLRSMLWLTGEPKAELSPPINDLAWWVQRQMLCSAGLTLKIDSPLRLLRQKKPLFRATFTELFPFLLRRVTAMLACHAGVELVTDASEIIKLAQQVDVVENRLYWQDLRTLNGADSAQDLGGLLGTLHLQGPALADLQWVLQLACVLNAGKGAAYGAGQLSLRTA